MHLSQDQVPHWMCDGQKYRRVADRLIAAMPDTDTAGGLIALEVRAMAYEVPPTSADNLRQAISDRRRLMDLRKRLIDPEEDPNIIACMKLDKREVKRLETLLRRKCGKKSGPTATPRATAPPRAAAATAAAAAPSGSNTVPIDYSKWDKLTLSDDSD